MEREEIIRKAMPIGVEMTAIDVSDATKEYGFMSLKEVSSMFRDMDDVHFIGKRSKTLKVPVEACDEEGPILDENGEPIIEYIKRRKEYRYWVRK